MPRVATADLGNKDASAPESINIKTSATLSPLSRLRTLTLATGAGGVKRLSSYAGILGLLGDLLREVERALRLRQAGTTYVKSGHLFNTGHRSHRNGLGTS